MADQAKAKKIRPFPIAVKFQLGTTEVVGQIMKLTLQGFLAEVGVSTLKPGERFDCAFELPVLHYQVAAPGVMVKLYNQWGGKPDAPAAGTSTNAPLTLLPTVGDDSLAKVVHLIEYHFTNLSSQNRTKIQIFLNAIQKGAK